MPWDPPPLVSPFVLVVLNAVIAELRSISERRPEDARLKSAVSNIEMAARSLSHPQV